MPSKEELMRKAAELYNSGAGSPEKREKIRTVLEKYYGKRKSLASGAYKLPGVSPYDDTRAEREMGKVPVKSVQPKSQEQEPVWHPSNVELDEDKPKSSALIKYKEPDESEEGYSEKTVGAWSPEKKKYLDSEDVASGDVEEGDIGVKAPKSDWFRPPVLEGSATNRGGWSGGTDEALSRAGGAALSMPGGPLFGALINLSGGSDHWDEPSEEEAIDYFTSDPEGKAEAAADPRIQEDLGLKTSFSDTGTYKMFANRSWAAHYELRKSEGRRAIRRSQAEDERSSIAQGADWVGRKGLSAAAGMDVGFTGGLGGAMLGNVAAQIGLGDGADRENLDRRIMGEDGSVQTTYPMGHGPGAGMSRSAWEAANANPEASWPGYIAGLLSPAGLANTAGQAARGFAAKQFPNVVARTSTGESLRLTPKILEGKPLVRALLGDALEGTFSGALEEVLRGIAQSKEAEEVSADVVGGALFGGTFGIGAGSLSRTLQGRRSNWRSDLSDRRVRSLVASEVAGGDSSLFGVTDSPSLLEARQEAKRYAGDKSLDAQDITRTQQLPVEDFLAGKLTPMHLRATDRVISEYFGPVGKVSKISTEIRNHGEFRKVVPLSGDILGNPINRSGIFRTFMEGHGGGELTDIGRLLADRWKRYHKVHYIPDGPELQVFMQNNPGAFSITDDSILESIKNAEEPSAVWLAPDEEALDAIKSSADDILDEFAGSPTSAPYPRETPLLTPEDSTEFFDWEGAREVFDKPDNWYGSISNADPLSTSELGGLKGARKAAMLRAIVAGNPDYWIYKHIPEEWLKPSGELAVPIGGQPAQRIARERLARGSGSFGVDDDVAQGWAQAELSSMGGMSPAQKRKLSDIKSRQSKREKPLKEQVERLRREMSIEHEVPEAIRQRQFMDMRSLEAKLAQSRVDAFEEAWLNGVYEDRGGFARARGAVGISKNPLADTLVSAPLDYKRRDSKGQRVKGVGDSSEISSEQKNEYLDRMRLAFGPAASDPVPDANGMQVRVAPLRVTGEVALNILKDLTHQAKQQTTPDDFDFLVGELRKFLESEYPGLIKLRKDQSDLISEAWSKVLNMMNDDYGAVDPNRMRLSGYSMRRAAQDASFDPKRQRPAAESRLKKYVSEAGGNTRAAMNQQLRGELIKQSRMEAVAKGENPDMAEAETDQALRTIAEVTQRISPEEWASMSVDMGWWRRLIHKIHGVPGDAAERIVIENIGKLSPGADEPTEEVFGEPTSVYQRWMF